MEDFSKLAGQTVDGFYYLMQDETIREGDKYLSHYDGQWIHTGNAGIKPSDLHNGPYYYRRPVATTQPVAPCSRCEELEQVILVADKLVSASDDVGGIRSLMIASDEYTAARARVKIGGEK